MVDLPAGRALATGNKAPSVSSLRDRRITPRRIAANAAISVPSKASGTGIGQSSVLGGAFDNPGLQHFDVLGAPPPGNTGCAPH